MEYCAFWASKSCLICFVCFDDAAGWAEQTVDDFELESCCGYYFYCCDEKL